jgi:hypothetical protein
MDNHAIAIHPAWQCAQRKLTNAERWNAWTRGDPAGYLDSQIALAMIVGGYGADVVVTERDEHGQPKAYSFPEIYVLVDEDASPRMWPHPRLFNEVHGAPAPAFFPVTERRYSLNGK